MIKFWFLDTQKNIVYILAKKYGVEGPEVKKALQLNQMFRCSWYLFSGICPTSCQLLPGWISPCCQGKVCNKFFLLTMEKWAVYSTESILYRHLGAVTLTVKAVITHTGLLVKVTKIVSFIWNTDEFLGPERTAQVIKHRNKHAEVLGGVSNFKILKTAKSSYVGFWQGKYTTLGGKIRKA